MLRNLCADTFIKYKDRYVSYSASDLNPIYSNFNSLNSLTCEELFIISQGTIVVSYLSQQISLLVEELVDGKARSRNDPSSRKHRVVDRFLVGAPRVVRSVQLERLVDYHVRLSSA